MPSKRNVGASWESRMLLCFLFAACIMAATPKHPSAVQRKTSEGMSCVLFSIAFATLPSSGLFPDCVSNPEVDVLMSEVPLWSLRTGSLSLAALAVRGGVTVLRVAGCLRPISDASACLAPVLGVPAPASRDRAAAAILLVRVDEAVVIAPA